MRAVLPPAGNYGVPRCPEDALMANRKNGQGRHPRSSGAADEPVAAVRVRCRWVKCEPVRCIGGGLRSPAESGARVGQWMRAMMASTHPALRAPRYLLWHSQE